MTTNNGSQNNREPKEEITLGRYELLEEQMRERLAAKGVQWVKAGEHPEWFPTQTTGAIFVPRIPCRRPSPSDEENTAIG